MVALCTLKYFAACKNETLNNAKKKKDLADLDSISGDTFFQLEVLEFTYIWAVFKLWCMHLKYKTYLLFKNVKINNILVLTPKVDSNVCSIGEYNQNSKNHL